MRWGCKSVVACQIGETFLEIVEIQGRTEQGVQQPFKCLADDGNLYYVKGRQTDRLSQCNELICGWIAREFGLPVPPFALLHVAEELLEETPSELRSIGAGIAFGSQHHPGCTWFDIAAIAHVPPNLQADVLAFDWWIQNIDRNTGNPNLLWDAASKKLVVIDHNLAFDTGIDAQTFALDHIFGSVWEQVDLVARDALQQRMCRTLDAVLDRACDNVPPEWHWNNPECDIPSNINLIATRSTLERCRSSDFWRFT